MRRAACTADFKRRGGGASGCPSIRSTQKKEPCSDGREDLTEAIVVFPAHGMFTFTVVDSTYVTRLRILMAGLCYTAACTYCYPANLQFKVSDLALCLFVGTSASFIFFF